jgi:hypothetical protein
MPETRPENGNRLKITVPQEKINLRSPEYYEDLYNVDAAKIQAFMDLQQAQRTRIFDGRRCFMTEIDGNRLFFLVRDTLPENLDDLATVDTRLAPVVCIKKVRITTKDGIYASKFPVPVLVAHGAIFRDQHTISSDQRMFSSQRVYQAINEILQANGLPPIAVFLSCDERSAHGVGTRWDFQHGVPLIGFASGPNAFADSGFNHIRRKFDKTLEIDQAFMAKQYGATLSSFTSSDPAKKALIEGIFKVDPFTQVRRKLVKAFEGLTTRSGR